VSLRPSQREGEGPWREPHGACSTSAAPAPAGSAEECASSSPPRDLADLSSGIAGILLCTVGTVVLARFAPEEAPVTSVEEVWSMAMQPVFRAYVCFVLSFTLALVYGAAPKYGKTHVVVYVAICSMIGSLSVMALRGIGIAAKLTMRGSDQLRKRETLFFILWVGCCIATQMNYLNKALDTFNTTMVSSVYYVFFTVCTVTASMIMYKDWENQTPGSIFWQVVALLVNVAGVHISRGPGTRRPAAAPACARCSRGESPRRSPSTPTSARATTTRSSSSSSSSSSSMAARADATGSRVDTDQTQEGAEMPHFCTALHSV